MKNKNLFLLLCLIFVLNTLKAQIIEQITNVSDSKNGVNTVNSEFYIEKFGNSLYFGAYYNVNGSYPSNPNLVKYDLTTKNITNVLFQNKEIKEPTSIYNIDNKRLLYWARGFDFGSTKHFYSTEGIANDIKLLSDKLINGPSCKALINNKLYFGTILNSNINSEFWVTDGTNAGTISLVDNENNPILFPCGFTKLNNNVIFSASTKYGQELFITDGINASKTFMVKDINPSTTANGVSGGIININDKIYFNANTPSSGNEPWVTDGTSEKTEMLKDINPGSASSNPNFIRQSEKIYLIAESPVVGRELWESDGTTDGTKLLSDSNLSGDLVSYWDAKIGDEVFIAANIGEKGYELYKIIDNKLELVKDINPGTGSSLTFTPPIVHNNILYFVANDGVNGFDVWTSDGIETKIIQNFESIDGVFPQIKLIKVIDDKLYFIQNVKDIGYELYAIDTKKLSKSQDLLNPKTFQIYPNPVSEILYSDQFLNAKIIKITNLLNNLELRSSGNINSIDVSNLESGIYIVEVEFLDKSQGVSRFVKI